MIHIDLSFLVCSYNTPQIILTCLKSLIYSHPKYNFKLLLSENSTILDTQFLLDKYNIPYFKNLGGRHAPSIDHLIQKCSTKYALVFDSDIIFQKDITPFYNKIKQFDFTIAGKRCGDRGGKRLFPRIEPWFCFINVDNIKKFNIRFGNDTIPSKDGRIYDVGSKMYEDTLVNKLKILDTENDMSPYFYHYEGMSWRKNTAGYIQWAKQVENDYQKEIEKYQNIKLEGRWIY